MTDNVLDAVSKAQNFIEENIARNITLSQLAKATNYSIPQLERNFKKTLGVTPFVYIRKLRLTAAAKALRDKDVKVLDTALDFLFDSHEGFTRAFSKEFGLSPYSYKKNPVPVNYYVSYNVAARKFLKKTKEIEEMKTVTIFTQIIEREQRKLILKKSKNAADYYAFCEELGCAEANRIWGVLSSIKEAKYEPAGFWLPQNMRKDGGEYAQGVEVSMDYGGLVPEGFDLEVLPAGKLMVFNSETFFDEDYENVINATWQAIEKYTPETYGYEWDCTQPRFQLEPRGERGYIEARPVKPIG